MSTRAISIPADSMLADSTASEIAEVVAEETAGEVAEVMAKRSDDTRQNTEHSTLWYPLVGVNSPAFLQNNISRERAGQGLSP
jgi:hypothetical protein